MTQEKEPGPNYPRGSKVNQHVCMQTSTHTQGGIHVKKPAARTKPLFISVSSFTHNNHPIIILDEML